MIQRPVRVTFRMKEAELLALRALAARTISWDDSKCIRLALSVLCHVILHDLPEDSPALVFRSISAQGLLERYRTAALAGIAQEREKSQTPPAKSDKQRKRVPQKPSSRFKGIPVR